jgi:hypothetical protein
MKELENKRYVDVKFRYYDNNENNLRIGSNIGIYGEQVGSGKTLGMITLLLENKKLDDKPIYHTSNRYTTISEINNLDEIININLIMVPKNIQHQWIKTLDNFITSDLINYVSHFDSSTKNIFNEFNEVNNKVNIILCNEKTIIDVMEKYNKKFLRLIIDEADTINCNSIEKIKASFIWLITGTTNGIA